MQDCEAQAGAGGDGVVCDQSLSEERALSTKATLQCSLGGRSGEGAPCLLTQLK